MKCAQNKRDPTYVALRRLTFDIHTAWSKATMREDWQRTVDTATKKEERTACHQQRFAYSSLRRTDCVVLLSCQVSRRGGS